MVSFFHPETLDEALAIRAEERVIPYAGGTDLMVQDPENPTYLFLNQIKELKTIREDENDIRIGACTTFSEALKNELVPPLMKEAIKGIASPAIRNMGTFGGNLGNGSDKADSALVLYATDGKIRLQSRGGERVISVNDFIHFRRDTDLRDDELITEILLPKENFSLSYYYQKVGGRNSLAISHAAIAGIADVNDGVIRKLSAAFIADAGTVLRFRDIEETLIGKTVNEAREREEDFLRACADRIRLGGGRVTAEYRKTVCLNLLRDFLDSMIFPGE